MRRKRRARGIWFPTFGSDCGVGDDYDEMAGIYGDLEVGDYGNICSAIRPLTVDVPLDSNNDFSGNSLADVVGSNWYLRRIVGKLTVYTLPDDGESPYCKVAAGFFVARADEKGNNDEPIGSTINDAPIGSASYVATNINYSPLALTTSREPWIWRRTWILSTGVGTETTEVPRNNCLFGSVLDGPHLDAKTKRLIGNDERLFFAISAARWPPTSQGPAEPPEPSSRVTYELDYRLFGWPRKARNRGAF